MYVSQEAQSRLVRIASFLDGDPEHPDRVVGVFLARQGDLSITPQFMASADQCCFL